MKSALPFAFAAQPQASASRTDAEPEPVASRRDRPLLLRMFVSVRA